MCFSPAVGHNQFQQQQQQQQQHTQMYTKYNNYNKSSWYTSVAILICLLACGISKTNAVPTDSTGARSTLLLQHRVQREAPTMAASLVQEEPKDAASTETAVDQPQGQCLLDGVLVAETTVFCEKQVGCRAIQKTGHCCPDYKCDCQKDGKTYLNGDKLVDPETPCTVCYCQGGEILCSSVTCFYRDDCTPKYIAGRCCPEYDNCPVSSTNRTLTTPPALTTSKPEAYPPPSVYNPKITIKEITKPTEIRITDDNKNKAVHQMRKPSTTETSTTTTITTAATATTTTPTASTMESFSKEINDESSVEAANSLDASQATISPTGGINNESLKLSASVAYPSTERAQAVVQHSTAEYSVEDFDEIVMVKNGNGDEKPISVFGTQGLQRVESETANDPSKINIKREYLVTTEGLPSYSTADVGDTNSAELIFGNTELQSSTNNSSQAVSTELEPNTAGSRNVYQFILTTDGLKLSTTEGILALKDASSTEGTEINPVSETNANAEQVSSDNIVKSIAEQQLTTEGPSNISKLAATTEVPMTTQGIDSTSSEPHKSTTESVAHVEEEDTVIPVESNPAYPSLPEDDFSLRDVTFPLSETDDNAEVDIKDEPRSIVTSYDTLKSTKHLDESTYLGTDGSGHGMDVDVSSTTDGLSSTTELPVGIAAKVELMFSAEDSSAETAISNNTDFRLHQLRKDSENETGSGSEESLEFETMEALLGLGSGSGDILQSSSTERNKSKQREHTTPRPGSKPELADIDGMQASGDGKLAVDPKLDVESLKLDEQQEEDAENKAVGVIKENISINPADVKSVDELESNNFESVQRRLTRTVKS